MHCPHAMQTPRAKRKTDVVGQAFLPVLPKQGRWARISVPQHRALPGIPFACERAYNSHQESTYGSAGCSRGTHFFGFGGLHRVGRLQLDASTSASAKVIWLPPSPLGIAIFHPRLEPPPAFRPRHAPGPCARPRERTRLRPPLSRSAFARRSAVREMTSEMVR